MPSYHDGYSRRWSVLEPGACALPGHCLGVNSTARCKFTDETVKGVVRRSAGIECEAITPVELDGSHRLQWQLCLSSSSSSAALLVASSSLQEPYGRLLEVYDWSYREIFKM